MNDTTPVKFQAQPEGQPEGIPTVDTNAQGNEQADNSQRQPFDIRELESIVEKTVSKSLESFSREQQSQRDRMEARIKGEVQKQLNVYQKAGYEVTDDMKEKVESVIRNDIANESRNNGSLPAEGQPTGKQDQSTGNPSEQLVNAELEELDKQYGVSLNRDDPEAQEIKDNLKPFQFIRAYEQALKAKAERLALPDQTTRTPFQQVHTSGGAGTPGNPLANMTSPDDIWGEVRKTMRR